jgi:pyruvate oxidase
LEQEPAHVETVSDVMVETMVNWGVNRVFGMVGHSNLGFADALKRQEEKGNLQFIGIRNEGAAAFAASAYGKLTGQVATQVVGTGNFQEVNLVRAFQSVAKFNQRVEHHSKHAELMTLAIKNAILKHDVSHLTFPNQVQVLSANEAKAQSSKGHMAPLTIAPPQESLDAAISRIKASKRPVIIVGHGARFHMAAIIKFAETMNCPVMTTFKGKGQISDSHSLGCGVLGRSGTPIASYFKNESDLIIVFGASFSNHTGITPKKAIIQIDNDPLAIAKFHEIEVGVYGEISRTVELLNQAENSLNTDKVDQTDEIAKRWKIWREEKLKRLDEERGNGISFIAVFETLTRLAPENAVMCVDVGNNAYSFARYFEAKNQSFLMSGYLGSIGFALPASIGAWAAAGDSRPVIAGDGGVCQYLAEFTTLVNYNIPVKLIVINNNELGKISKKQRAGGWPKWATDLVNPNFAGYAASCGGLGIQVQEKDALENGFEQLLVYKGPALLEVMADVNLI